MKQMSSARKEKKESCKPYQKQKPAVSKNVSWSQLYFKVDLKILHTKQNNHKTARHIEISLSLSLSLSHKLTSQCFYTQSCELIPSPALRSATASSQQNQDGDKKVHVCLIFKLFLASAEIFTHNQFLINTYVHNISHSLALFHFHFHFSI